MLLGIDGGCAQRIIPALLNDFCQPKVKDLRLASVVHEKVSQA